MKTSETLRQIERERKPKRQAIHIQFGLSVAPELSAVDQRPESGWTLQTVSDQMENDSTNRPDLFVWAVSGNLHR